MAEVESMNEGAQFGGVESTYIEAIDGPRDGAESTESAAPEGDTADATEQSSEADATGQETGQEQPSYSKDPVINGLIAKLAKEHPKLDPADPEDLKLLNRLAHSQKHINELKSKAAQPQDHLTDYERTALNPKDPATAATETARTTATEATVAQPGFFDGDPGVAWRKPDDAYIQLNDAWRREGGPDYDLINRIDIGMFHRRAQQSGYLTEGQALALVDKTIQERLGDVLPDIRQTVEMQQSQANKSFALAELAKSPDWATIADLETESDGEPLVYAGETFPNTALNRILIDNPEILDINVTRNAKGQLLSKKDSERLTYMARFRAAGRISKQGQMTDGKAKLALEAGQKQAERASGDRVRQGLNGGKGATTLPNGKKTGSLVHELVNDGGPRSFSSL